MESRGGRILSNLGKPLGCGEAGLGECDMLRLVEAVQSFRFLYPIPAPEDVERAEVFATQVVQCSRELFRRPAGLFQQLPLFVHERALAVDIQCAPRTLG